MNILHSTLSSWRDRLAPISHTSTFRETGQITPEEFVLAGDYLVYKFPTWSWGDASSEDRRVSYLPQGKQFLYTRGVPCHRRLDENFAGSAPEHEAGAEDGEDDDWMRAEGGTSSSNKTSKDSAQTREVRTVDDSGNIGDRAEDEDDEIPDMEDEDDEEAIIREQSDTTTPLRTYTLYITYTPYYRTPRLYMSGYTPTNEPLAPHLMLDDIVGDYKEKTVTLEDFPFTTSPLKMASVHPCKHASVMKVLLDRADAALKLRMQKYQQASSSNSGVVTGLEGLVDDLTLQTAQAAGSARGQSGYNKGAEAGGSAAGGDEWEVLQPDAAAAAADEVAIRVDQYLVVFLKFMASVTPTIEHDFTMGV